MLERVVRGDYLDPDGGTAAFEQFFSLGRQDRLVAGPRGAALSVSGMALSGSCLQGQIQGLVAVQTVHGVVEATAILGPRGHPLGTAVLVGILCGFCAALGRHGNQRLGGGPRGHRGRCLLIICVGDSCKRERERKKKAQSVEFLHGAGLQL